MPVANAGALTPTTLNATIERSSPVRRRDGGEQAERHPHEQR